MTYTAYVTVKVEIDPEDKPERKEHAKDSVRDTVDGFLSNYPSYLSMDHVENIEIEGVDAFEGLDL